MRHKQRLYALTLHARLHEQRYAKPIVNAKRVISHIIRDNNSFRARALHAHHYRYYALGVKRTVYCATLTPAKLYAHLRGI